MYSEVSYIDQHGEPVDKETPYERYSGVVTDKLVIKNFVPFGTAVIRRSCMEEDGAFDEDSRMVGGLVILIVIVTNIQSIVI